jgi:DNA-binding NtrC family response regulator
MPPETNHQPSALVATDEPLLVRLYVRILESAAFVVQTAGDCRTALARLAVPGTNLCLVVTDLRAVQSGGRDLGSHLAERLPAVPVLRVVGRPCQPGRLVTDDRLGYILPKPFTTAELLGAVEFLCGGQPEPRERTTRHGFPTARTFGGRSRTTTLPAPTTVFSPMLTPGQTIAPPPSQTPSPIVTGSASSSPEFRVAASNGWVQV